MEDPEKTTNLSQVTVTMWFVSYQLHLTMNGGGMYAIPYVIKFVSYLRQNSHGIGLFGELQLCV
jgi:hypothetical protein